MRKNFLFKIKKIATQLLTLILIFLFSANVFAGNIITKANLDGTKTVFNVDNKKEVSNQSIRYVSDTESKNAQEEKYLNDINKILNEDRDDSKDKRNALIALATGIGVFILKLFGVKLGYKKIKE